MSVCQKHRVPISHRARQLSARDFAEFDYILGMDSSNISNINRVRPAGSAAKGTPRALRSGKAAVARGLKAALCRSVGATDRQWRSLARSIPAVATSSRIPTTATFLTLSKVGAAAPLGRVDGSKHRLTCFL